MCIFKHMRIGYVILLKCVGLLFNIYTADCDVQQWWPERLKCLSTPHCSSPNLGDNALFRAADVLVGQWIGECSKLRVHYSKPAPKLLFEQFGGPLGRSTWCNEGKTFKPSRCSLLDFGGVAVRWSLLRWLPTLASCCWMTPWWGSTTSGANRCPITGRGAVIEHLRYNVARPEKSSISLIRCAMNHELEVYYGLLSVGPSDCALAAGFRWCRRVMFTAPRGCQWMEDLPVPGLQLSARFNGDQWGS